MERSDFPRTRVLVQIVWRTGSTATTYYAVTSCSESFNPTFRLPDGTPIRLNKTTLGTLLFNSKTDPWADYFFPAATADADFYDIDYEGNPGNYKTFAWGFDDACLNLPSWTKYEPRNIGEPLVRVSQFQSPVSRAPAAVELFRRRLPVNTYAETAPTVNFSDANTAFQVGVDRILIRTVTFPTYGRPTLHGRFRTGPRRPLPNKPPSNIQGIADCFSSPLNLAFAQVAPGSGRAYVPFINRPVPSYVRPLVGSRFIVVDGEFQGRKFDTQRAIVLLPKFATGVPPLARQAREYCRGFIEPLLGGVVVWTLKPNRNEEELATNCLGPPPL